MCVWNGQGLQRCETFGALRLHTNGQRLRVQRDAHVVGGGARINAADVSVEIQGNVDRESSSPWRKCGGARDRIGGQGG
jgi:hypothetical protein